jgi:hypothetical protein
VLREPLTAMVPDADEWLTEADSLLSVDLAVKAIR